jgi:indolepyruvate ferredoxin oxidoreductase beta subunit
MKQQIIISGLGGQGALTLTRLLAEAAATLGLPVITSETHGMAQRGGTVISMVKVGLFRSPLIPAGSADVGLFLHRHNLAVHSFYLKPGGAVFINTDTPGDYRHIDAGGLALSQDWPPVAANFILLGFAAGQDGLFCSAGQLAHVINAIMPARFLEMNLSAFRMGVEQAV